MSARDSSPFTVGDWLVEPELDRISCGREITGLRPQVMELLVYLAERAGRVVSSDELLDSLWKDKVVTSGTVYNCIAELRHALEAADGSKASIETIPRRGYRLLGKVKGLSESADTAGKRRRAIATAAAAVVTLAGFSLAVWLMAGPTTCPNPENSLQRLVIDIPRGLPDDQGQSIAVSRDGRYVIFAVNSQHRLQLYSRSIDSLESTPIRGADGIEFFFDIAPDGKSIVFFDIKERTLNKVPITGGMPVTLARLGVRSHDKPAWSSRGTIAFSRHDYDGLLQVSASGGVVTKLTFPEDDEVHKQPSFLPNGDALLFTIGERGVVPRRSDRIAALSLTTGEQKYLLEGSSPTVTAMGHLVYYRDNTLWAAELDTRRLVVTSESVVIAENVGYLGVAAYDISANGTLIYLPAMRFSNATLVWVDRDGNEEAIPFDPRHFKFPRISPAGDRVAVTIDDGSQPDLWIYSLDGGAATRMTNDEPGEVPGAWDSDGRYFYYSSDSVDNIYRVTTSGTGVIEQLTKTPTRQFPDSITPDGRQLIYSEFGTATQGDLATLEISGVPTSSFVLQTPSTEGSGQISPDGHWLAYSSNLSGQQEIYLRRFPVDANDPAWQISIGGGQQPKWSRDGREIFYWGATEIMAVEIETGSEVLAQPPEALFSHEAYRYNSGVNYDLSRSDGRFLFVKHPTADQTAIEKIVVVQNWLDDVSCRIAAL